MIYRFYYYTEEYYNNSKNYVDINIYMLLLPNVLGDVLPNVLDKLDVYKTNNIAVVYDFQNI